MQYTGRTPSGTNGTSVAAPQAVHTAGCRGASDFPAPPPADRVAPVFGAASSERMRRTSNDRSDGPPPARAAGRLRRFMSRQSRHRFGDTKARSRKKLCSATVKVKEFPHPTQTRTMSS